MLNYYRKVAEKVRSFFSGHLTGWHINIFLFVAAIVVLTIIIAHQVFRVTEKLALIDLGISSNSVNLFGRDTVNAFIREFEEQNPGLRIQISAEVPPSAADIVFFDDGEFSSLANDTYLHTETLVSFMDIFLYNIDVLEAANCDRPPKTRVEFIAAAKAVAESNTARSGQDAVFPFALGLNQADPAALRRDFYPWVWVNGGDIHSIDASVEPPVFPRVVTDVITFLGQLNREGLLASASFEKTGTQRLEEFARGKIAMMTSSVRDLIFLQNNAHGVNFGISALPAATHGKNRLGLSNIYAGINSDCTLPDEALLFLEFLVEKKPVLAEELGAVPGSFPGVFSGEYIAEDTLYSKAWDIFQTADIVEYKFDQSVDGEINRVVREKLAEQFRN